MIVAALLPFLVARQSTVRLQFMPPIGKTFKYVMKMDMHMAMPAMAGAGAKPMTMDMVMNVGMKALKRSGDVTTLESHMDAPKVSGTLAGMMQGQMGKGGEPKTYTMDMDRNYHIKSATGAASPLTGAMGSVSFPDHAIHVGETWTNTVDLGQMMGAMGKGSAGMNGKIPMKFRLESIKNSGGEKLAMLDISMVTSLPISSGGQSVKLNMNGTGTCAIDIATGMYVSYDMKIEVSASAQGQSFKQEMTQSLTRV